MIQVYHNPRCGKSRNCLAFMTQSGLDYEIINYLDNPPSFDELVSVLNKLDSKPLDLVRQKEKIWIENFKNKGLSDSEIIQAMVSHPILIERPIVITDNKAIIGRDLDQLNSFL